MKPSSKPPSPSRRNHNVKSLLLRRLYWRIWLGTLGVMLVFSGLVLAAWFFSHPNVHGFVQDQILVVRDTDGYMLFTVPVTPSPEKALEGVVFALELNASMLWNEPIFYLELPPSPPPLAKWGGPPWLTSVPLFLGLFGLAFLLLAIFMLPFMRHLTRRLEGLQATVAAWGSGDLSARAEVQGNDEVAFLASEFNHTATQIQTLLETHKSLLANASHELRSPLTRLRMRLELSRHALPQADQAEMVRNLTELDQLIEEILLASRLDSHGVTLPDPVVDIAGLLAEECARAEVELQAQSCAAQEVANVQGSAKLLRRLLRNLLENAQRYGGDADAIHAAIVPDPDKPGWILVRVCDRGPGVPEKLRERVFEPFFRLPGTSEYEGGVGLGLALVRSIAEHHGGSVVCCAREDGQTGACFALRLRVVAAV